MVAFMTISGIPRGLSLQQRSGGTAALHGARVAELDEHRDITSTHTVQFSSGDGIPKGSLPKVPWPSSIEPCRNLLGPRSYARTRSLPRYVLLVRIANVRRASDFEY